MAGEQKFDFIDILIILSVFAIMLLPIVAYIAYSNKEYEACLIKLKDLIEVDITYYCQAGDAESVLSNPDLMYNTSKLDSKLIAAGYGRYKFIFLKNNDVQGIEIYTRIFTNRVSKEDFQSIVLSRNIQPLVSPDMIEGKKNGVFNESTKRQDYHRTTGRSNDH